MPASRPTAPACVFYERISLADAGMCFHSGSRSPCYWEPGLQIAPGLPVYARLVVRYQGKEDVRITVPQGKHQRGAEVEASDQGVTLRGHVTNQSDGYLFARRPLRLSEAVVVGCLARLRWYTGIGGSLLVGPHRVTSFSPTRPLRALVPCSGLSLEEEYDDEDGVVKKMMGVGSPLGKVVLKKQRRIPLYRAGDRKLQGTFYIERRGPDAVEVIKQTADQILVFVDYYYFYLHGWIPADAVDRPASTRIRAPRVMATDGVIDTEKKRRGGACGSDKALFVKYRNRHHQVGTLGVSARFVVDSQKGAWTRITLKNTTWFKLVSGYYLYLRSDALGDCKLRRISS